MHEHHLTNYLPPLVVGGMTWLAGLVSGIPMVSWLGLGISVGWLALGGVRERRLWLERQDRIAGRSGPPRHD